MGKEDERNRSEGIWPFSSEFAAVNSTENAEASSISISIQLVFDFQYICVTGLTSSIFSISCYSQT